MSDVTLTAPLDTYLYVVRHAEVHNPEDIVYGRLPRFRLSERGFRQAESLARFLSGRAISTIYTSPLLRARQTAETIARAIPGAEVRRSSLLLEVRTGHEGSPNSIIKPGFSFYEPLKHPHDETMEHVFARLARFLRLTARRHPGEAVVAVSHGDPIAIMRLGLMGLPLTVSNLHATVYPVRASINLVTVKPDGDPLLTYFDVARAPS